jgi:hypothetical protein
MRHFLIRYRRGSIGAEEWHRDIARFIAALNDDAELSGKISYRCMRIADGDEYLHAAAATDEQAVKTLQSRDFFKRYNEQTRQAAANGAVEVVKVEIVGETKFRA